MNGAELLVGVLLRTCVWGNQADYGDRDPCSHDGGSLFLDSANSNTLDCYCVANGDFGQWAADRMGPVKHQRVAPRQYNLTRAPRTSDE
jgi:hypothetical protein